MAAAFKACEIVGCNGDAHNSAGGRRGLCRSHRQRQGRHGNPEAGRTAQGVPLAWLEEVTKYTGDDCQIWPFAKTGKGYGKIVIARRWIGPHVWVCTRVNGDPQQPGLEAAHSCGVRLCCNPKHIRWATPKDNAKDKIAHGTASYGEAHRGAKLTEADVVEIRRREAAGANRKVSAKDFGVAVATIEDIAHRRTWKHLR